MCCPEERIEGRHIEFLKESMRLGGSVFGIENGQVAGSAIYDIIRAGG